MQKPTPDPGTPSAAPSIPPLARTVRARDTGRVRIVSATAAAAVTAVIGAGAAAVAAGRLASDAALKAPPGRPLPTEPRLSVHALAAGQITLTRDLASLRPGTYGLAGNGSHAVVGPVLHDREHSPDSVVRRLERVTHGTLEPGDKVWLTPGLHTGDPKSALGLDHTEVTVPGELGDLPAWFLPGQRATWVITTHGLGATREHPMNVMGLLHRLDLPVLDLSYRGDAGAPRSPDRLNHFGETEWRDLDAAIRYAARSGARRVVLHGWSTGATMALRAALYSTASSIVAGLILDSPVFSWEATLRALVAARHTPAPLLPLAVRAAQGRTRQGRAVPPDDGSAGGDPTGGLGVRVPTLIFHGPDDRVAPWEFSRRFAGRHPNLATLHTVHDAPHGAMWNVDPEGYEEQLRRFLTPLM